MAVCCCCQRGHRKHRATLTWVFSDTSDSPSAHFQGKSYGKLKPHHGSGAPLATTPFLIPSSPFLPFTHHFSSGRPGWGKASLAQHNFPRPRSLDRSEP